MSDDEVRRMLASREPKVAPWLLRIVASVIVSVVPAPERMMAGASLMMVSGLVIPGRAAIVNSFVGAMVAWFSMVFPWMSRPEGWIVPKLNNVAGVPAPSMMFSFAVDAEVIVELAPIVRLPLSKEKTASFVPLRVMGALIVCMPFNARM